MEGGRNSGFAAGTCSSSRGCVQGAALSSRKGFINAVKREKTCPEAAARPLHTPQRTFPTLDPGDAAFGVMPGGPQPALGLALQQRGGFPAMCRSWHSKRLFSQPGQRGLGWPWRLGERDGAGGSSLL